MEREAQTDLDAARVNEYANPEDARFALDQFVSDNDAED